MEHEVAAVKSDPIQVKDQTTESTQDKTIESPSKNTRLPFKGKLSDRVWNAVSLRSEKGASNRNKSVQGVPPPYLSIPNYKECLGTQAVGRSLSEELCLLDTKPNNCPQMSFDLLQEVFKGEVCRDQNQRQDITVEGHSDCLGTQMIGGSKQLCMLNQKPLKCPQKAFDTLREVFKGEVCRDQKQEQDIIAEGIVGLPPAYLSVEGHRDCLGTQIIGGSKQLCLLNKKPWKCAQEAFDTLQEVFKGEVCQDQNQKQDITVGGINGLPPTYLSVPNHRDCLGTEKSSRGGHLCLLKSRPWNCPQESFDQLQEVFQGDFCQDQTILHSLDFHEHLKKGDNANSGDNSSFILGASMSQVCFLAFKLSPKKVLISFYLFQNNFSKIVLGKVAQAYLAEEVTKNQSTQMAKALKAMLNLVRTAVAEVFGVELHSIAESGDGIQDFLRDNSKRLNTSEVGYVLY